VNNATKSKIIVDANGAMIPFDVCHSGGSDSCYSAYSFQNDSNEESGRLSEMQGFSSDEQMPLAYHSWAMQEEPYQQMDCAQSTPRNRNVKDGIDCGSEADLYGLVSNILEEVDPMDSYFCQEMSTGLTTGWSPMSQENSLQYLNSEVKAQFSSGMQHNPEPSIKLHTRPVERESDQSSDVFQTQFSSFAAADPSWLFSTCNGESKLESYTSAFPNLHRSPPGFDILRSNFSKGRSVKSEHGVSVKDSRFQSISDESRPDVLNDHCSLPFGMNDSFFSPYQDFSASKGLRTERNMPYSMEDVNKLPNSLEAFLVGEQEGLYNRESAQSMGQISSLKRELTRLQRGSGVGTPEEFADFGQQSADCFEPPKAYTSSFNFSTQQSKEANQREARNVQAGLNHYHHGKSNQFHGYTKPPPKTTFNFNHPSTSKFMADFAAVLSQQQMQRIVPKTFTDFGQGDVKTCHVGLGLGAEGPGKLGGSVDRGDFDLQSEMARLQTSSANGFIADAPRFGMKPKSPVVFPKEADKKKGLLQHPCQIRGNVYSGQARHNGATPAPCQMFPSLYQMGQNPCHTLPEVWSDAELLARNPYLQDMMGLTRAGGDGVFPELISNLRSTNSHGGTVNQLHYYLEECFERLRVLEKDRKKAEAILQNSFPDMCILSVTNTNSVPKLPVNPTGVDRLIVDQFREQAKVVNLLGKVERLRSFPLHANISSTLDRHLEAIYITQARRKDESISSSRQRQGMASLREDR
ncbi:meiosis-specific coiled-coil domain-containing protein MEIOC isoform X2, partial [Clarias magur]